MDKEKKRRIFLKLKKCFNSLVGSSGHLAAYNLDYETFKITNTITMENNIKYHFTVNGYYESEFTYYTEDTNTEAASLKGSIVLDPDLNYVRDEKGNICLYPWKCLDPEKYNNKKESINKAVRKDQKNKNKLDKNGSSLLSMDEIDKLLDNLHD